MRSIGLLRHKARALISWHLGAYLNEAKRRIHDPDSGMEGTVKQRYERIGISDDRAYRCMRIAAHVPLLEVQERIEDGSVSIGSLDQLARQRKEKNVTPDRDQEDDVLDQEDDVLDQEDDVLDQEDDVLDQEDDVLDEDVPDEEDDQEPTTLDEARARILELKLKVSDLESDLDHYRDQLQTRDKEIAKLRRRLQ